MAKLANKLSLYSISEFILLSGFIIFYFTDGILKILNKLEIGSNRYAIIIKGLFILAIIIYYLFTARAKNFKFLLALVPLIVFFFIGQIVLSINFESNNILENTNSLFKYLFLIFLFIPAYDILLHNKYPKRLLKYYKLIISINSVLIIIGLMFSSIIFTTYPSIHRFGYDGLIVAQNEASYIFIFALTTVYYRRFYLNIKEFFFWLVIISSIFVATKAVFLFLLLLISFHIIKKLSFKQIIVFLVSIILLLIAFIFSPLTYIFENSWQIFMNGYNKHGLLWALLSGRNTFIYDKMIPLINDIWIFPNYFFGGQDVSTFLIEMEFIDIFLFFGILGTVVYSFIMFNIFSYIPFNRGFKIFFILSLLAIIATAGHFFQSGIVGIHFVIFLLINQEIVKTN